MKTSCKILLSASLTYLLGIAPSLAREHQIYSVEEELSMGRPNEILKKNYYVNIGQNQGVSKGTMLNVYRVISNLNPYENQKRINHRVKIGELKILHADQEAAIGALSKLNNGPNDPLFEIENFMIGDHVSVSVNE